MVNASTKQLVKHSQLDQQIFPHQHKFLPRIVQVDIIQPNSNTLVVQ